MDERPRACDLLDQVELRPVRGQYRQPGPSGGEQDQGVVQSLLALRRRKPLRARQGASDQAGHGPYARLRHQHTVVRHGLEQLDVLVKPSSRSLPISFSVVKPSGCRKHNGNQPPVSAELRFMGKAAPQNPCEIPV